MEEIRPRGCFICGSEWTIDDSEGPTQLVHQCADGQRVFIGKVRWGLHEPLPRYATRSEAREAIEAELKENLVLLKERSTILGSQSGDLTWHRKLATRVFPNNRKILTVLDANLTHLREDEVETLECFRRYANDIEQRHQQQHRGRYDGGPAEFPAAFADILLPSRKKQFTVILLVPEQKETAVKELIDKLQRDMTSLGSMVVRQNDVASRLVEVGNFPCKEHS